MQNVERPPVSHEPMPVDPRVCALFRALAHRRGIDKPTFADLAAPIDDWDGVLKLAHEHRLLPLLIAYLPDIEMVVPQSARELLQAEHDRNVFHCLANASELIALLAAFDRAGIAAMPFKGIGLAASVYGDLTGRSAGDLDFLVFRRDLETARSVLQQRGYELKTQLKDDGSPSTENYYEYHFERARDGMVAELRWRLELTEQQKFRRDLGMEWVWPRRCKVRVAGVDVPDLNPVDKLLVLCMHGSKHLWSRMIWICDVARLLEKESPWDWRAVTREAKKRGLWRPLALGVLLAHRVCGAMVPAQALRAFTADRAARQLAEHFAANLFDAPGRMPPGRLPYSFRLLDFSDRFELVFSAALLRPNARDLAVVRLPRVLRPVYYLIRPLRILLDRSPR